MVEPTLYEPIGGLPRGRRLPHEGGPRLQAAHLGKL